MLTNTFKLSKPMLSLLDKHNIKDATPIQKEIIPAILAGRDILAQSETGSGKTISFAVPIIEQIIQQDKLLALILVPTRELCVQITDEFEKFSKGKNLGVTAVYGGVSAENQIRKIKKANILIATPGRLIDLFNRGAIKFEKIKFLVFDEADRMLDMGFIKDIEKIIKFIPQKRQTMLFSATVSKEIAKLSQKYLQNPVRVSLESTVKPEFLRQTYYQISQEKKISLLIQLLKKEGDLVLVFCNRKHITDKLSKKLRAQGINARCLHGDMSQSQRERVTSDFRNKHINVLVATDVAARGLHIEDISHVYNYEIPKDVDSYTHRVGRTARAGQKGEAISFVTGGEDQKFFKQILFSYSGNIKLKTIDPSTLPNIEQPRIQNEKSHKLQQQRSNPVSLKKETKFFNKIESKSMDDKKSKSWDDKKSKSWDDKKSKSWDDKKSKSWDDKKSKPWDDKKSKSWDDKKSKPRFDNKSKSNDDRKSKSWNDKKSKSWNNKKSSSFTADNQQYSDELGYKKPEKSVYRKPDKYRSKSLNERKSNNKVNKNNRTWEERKPKFWSEKKAKTWRDKLVKMFKK